MASQRPIGARVDRVIIHRGWPTPLATVCVALILGGCAAESGRQHWTTLLDGARPDTLSRWHRVGPDNWRIQSGTVMADALTGKGSTYLVSNESFANVRIRAQVWVTAETNSGVFFRCDQAGKISADICYEMNIWDKRPDPSYGTASIVNYAKVYPMPLAGGKWSTFEVIADGPHLVVFMDGQKTVDTIDATHANGPIALQWAGGIVKWRKVEVMSIAARR
jgi:Domain of Unknown Function (DUF1080)